MVGDTVALGGMGVGDSVLVGVKVSVGVKVNVGGKPVVGIGLGVSDGKIAGVGKLAATSGSFGWWACHPHDDEDNRQNGQ